MNKYLIPHTVYHKTQWLIRDYARLREEYANTGTLSAVDYDGMPHGSEASDPTLRDALRRAEIAADLKAIDAGLRKLPEEYREGVLNSIVNHDRYPDTAHLNTWKRWRQRLVYWVAYEKGWI